jgi:hypothetical protein
MPHNCDCFIPYVYIHALCNMYICTSHRQHFRSRHTLHILALSYKRSWWLVTVPLLNIHVDRGGWVRSGPPQLHLVYIMRIEWFLISVYFWCNYVLSVNISSYKWTPLWKNKHLVTGSLQLVLAAHSICWTLVISIKAKTAACCEGCPVREALECLVLCQGQGLVGILYIKHLELSDQGLYR